MKQLIDLKGRRALVTGGGRGIGRSIALALADSGADVAVASRSLSELEGVAREIRERGTRGFAVVIDVMSREGITAGVDEAARKLGGLDILINNAGGVIAQNPAHLDRSITISRLSRTTSSSTSPRRFTRPMLRCPT